MKVKILLTAVAMTTAFSGNVFAQDGGENPRVLVAYFSQSGNTRAVANQIKELTGGDSFEIESAKPYPTVYRECTDYAKKEKEANARPALKGKVDSMADYDIVFVGFPNWWGTMPMPLFTFLNSCDFTGKTLIPFCTHGGGGEQQCFTDFAKETKKYDTRKGFIINGSSANSARAKVQGWLTQIGVTK